MKKWLTFILLLIALTGTFFPCCLVDECNEKELVTSQKESKQQPEGACSPFFACATCPGFTEMSKPIQVVHPVFEKPVYYQSTLTFNLPTYSPSFWQPPRSC
jgi:hypothetical protein